MRLGDIIISYPEVIRESVEQEMLVDDRVEEFSSHGCCIYLDYTMSSLVIVTSLWFFIENTDLNIDDLD